VPMYMSSKDRRTVLLLAQIPPGSKVRVTYQSTVGPKEWLWPLLGYDEERNEISFQRDATKPKESFPLDRVASVFFHEREWRIMFLELPIT
jgi:hypothetical protein